MKKQLKIVIFAFIVLIVVVAAYFILNALLPDPPPATPDGLSMIAQRSKSGEPAKVGTAEDMSIVAVSYPADLQEGYEYFVIRVASEESESLLYFYDDGKEDMFHFDQELLKDAFTRFLDLEIKEVVSENETDLEQYRLDDEHAVRVIISPADGKDYDKLTLLIGAENKIVSGGGGFYAKWDDRPEVYLISTFDANTYLRGSLRYRSLNVFPGLGTYYDAVKTVTLENKYGDIIKGRRNESFESDKEGEIIYTTFKMIEPYDAYINDSAFGEGLLDLISTANAVEVVMNNPTKDDLAKYGLDKPGSVTIELKDLTVTYKIGVPSGNTAGGAYYMMVNDVDSIFMVYGEATFLDHTPLSVRATLVWLHDIKKVNTIDIKTPSGEYKFFVDDTTDATAKTGTFTATLDGEVMSEDNGRRLYQSIISASYDDVMADKLEEKTPAYRYKITYKSGFSETVSFYKVTSRQYAVFFGDNPDISNPGFTVNIVTLRKTQDNIEIIKSGGAIPR